MLGREVREYEPVELNESMTVLQSAFGRHLDERDVAFCLDRVGQELLHEESSRHAHLAPVLLAFASDLETDGARACSRVARRLEDDVQELDGTRLAFGPGDANNEDTLGGKVVYECS
jgi:hypothetical protein